MQEYYDILGIQPGASEEEIKKQYKKRCFDTHPDRNNGNSEEFLKVTKAYEALCGGKSQSNNGDMWSNFPDMEELRSMFDHMNRTFARAYQKSRPPSNDYEIGLNLNLSVEDIKNGKELGIQYRKSVDCSVCSGVGGKSRKVCEGCQGNGMVRQARRQGNVMVSALSPCQKCAGRGILLEDVCQTCSGDGYTVVIEELKFEIKRKG